MMRLSVTAMVALALNATPVAAQTRATVDLDAVEREVAAFIGVPAQEAGSAFSPIDRRLRLAACPRELDLQWYGSRRDTVQVRCPLPGSWKLYVRAYGSGPAQAKAQTLVKRGDEVTVTLAGSGFSVSRSAEALENGAEGEWIRIRVEKGSELRAKVLRPGAVALSLR